jgi:hypothetical protein
MTRIWSTGHFYELWLFVLSEEEWATMLNAVAQQDLLWAEELLQQGSHYSLTQAQPLVARVLAGKRKGRLKGRGSEWCSQSVSSTDYRLLPLFPLAVIQYNLG